jgi:phage gp29-like protein
MNPSRLVFTIAAFVALTGTRVYAQQTQQTPPNPEQLKQVMQATMGAMVSVMGPMTEAVIDAQLNSAAKPETAEKIATFKRNLYEALLKKGFNGIDAMQIVISTSMPSAAPATK